MYLVGRADARQQLPHRGLRRAVLLRHRDGDQRHPGAVEKLTDLPVLVVNSHYHFDHVGGNHLFDDIAIHELGVRAAARARRRTGCPAISASSRRCSRSTRCSARSTRRGSRSWRRRCRCGRCRATFDRAAWRTVATRADPAAAGRRRARPRRPDAAGPAHARATPRTASACWTTTARILFTGDTIDTGPMYAQYDGVEHRRPSSRRPQARDVRRPGGRPAQRARRAVPVLPRADRPGRRRVRRGAATAVELFDSQDCFGQPAKEARFGDFSILVGSKLDGPRQLT